MSFANTEGASPALTSNPEGSKALVNGIGPKPDLTLI